MTSEAQVKSKRTQAGGSRLNSKRYFYLVVGYYLVTVYLRAVRADVGVGSPSGGHAESGDQLGFADSIPTDHSSGHKSHGIQITKVDFEGVETPFIIALWIFCASLAKIGKSFYSRIFYFHLSS